MKIIKKLMVLFFIFLSVFFIYKTLRPHQVINYIPLGDSVAEGYNSYGNVDYGYPDYVKDYLKEKGKLGFYTKQFAKSGYKTQDLKEDLENNKVIVEDGKKVYLRSALRDSNLVTLSIGANDFLATLRLTENPSSINVALIKQDIDKVAAKVEEVVVEIKKYAKEDIILIGYYNPLPRLTTYKKEIDELICYGNHLFEEIAKKQKIMYLDIFDLFDGNTEFLPNPLDIHPNRKGYEAISKKIIEKIEDKS